MRIPFLSMFMASPFDGLEEHAERVKNCAWAFQKAIACHMAKDCELFEELRKEVIVLENQADAIKRRIRGHLPKGTLMPVDKFELFRYLREQDAVLDSVEGALNWLSFRIEPGIPEVLSDDFLRFVELVIEPLDVLNDMVKEAKIYFKSFSEKNRVRIKDMIRSLREQEHTADKQEALIKQKALTLPLEPTTVFHMVRLAEYIGAIADHAENAGDMMRAMVAK